jgi:hypothetical protein
MNCIDIWHFAFQTTNVGRLPHPLEYEAVLKSLRVLPHSQQASCLSQAKWMQEDSHLCVHLCKFLLLEHQTCPELNA